MPILNKLYKQTQLQTTFGIIFLTIVNNQPKYLNLKEMISHFVNFRKEVVTRRSTFELNKAQDRLHILEGLKIALDNIDRVVAIIRAREEHGRGEKRPDGRLSALGEAGPEHPRHAPCPPHVARAHEDPGRAEPRTGRDKAAHGHPAGRALLMEVIKTELSEVQGKVRRRAG